MIPLVSEITAEMYANCSGKSKLGTGGMSAKLRAAEKMLAKKKELVIMNSSKLSALYDLLDGKDVGTLFSAN